MSPWFDQTPCSHALKPIPDKLVVLTFDNSVASQHSGDTYKAGWRPVGMIEISQRLKIQPSQAADGGSNSAAPVFERLNDR